MKNLTRVYYHLVDVLLSVSELPTDCPDAVLNDGFQALRQSAFGCLRRCTEFLNESVSNFVEK